MSRESDDVLREELALQLWNGISDVHKKADAMMPWLLGKLAEAEYVGFATAMARIKSLISTEQASKSATLAELVRSRERADRSPR